VLKFLAPWVKWAQNGGEKVEIFVTGTMEFFFLVTGQIGMKFGKTKLNRYALLDLNKRILKIFR